MGEDDSGFVSPRTLKVMNSSQGTHVGQEEQEERRHDPCLCARTGAVPCCVYGLSQPIDKGVLLLET